MLPNVPVADQSDAPVAPNGPLATTLGVRLAGRLPGVAAAAALAGVATLLGRLAPVVGAPVIAIVGGMVLGLVRPPAAGMRQGLAFTSRTILQTSIVVLGTGLSLRQVVATGARSLPVLLGTLAVALLGAALLGRRLSIARDLRTLIGVGTGICGASAVAATDAVISAGEVDVAYAITTIFTFNVAAVLTFPTLGRLLGLHAHAFGVWAGTAVNDMSSVVAASSIFGHGATSYAVVVKLTRTLMIIPITLGLALWRARKLPAAERPGTSTLTHLRRAFPVFVAWFVLAVVVNTLGFIPAGWHGGLSAAAAFLITMALGAIGLSARLRDIRRAGLRPLALGAMLWVLVAASSLGLQAVTGTLH
jgi:uncharacterized integral membrane protein (TIGR00698 family)